MVTCPNRLGGSVIDLICVSGEMWADWGELKVWQEDEGGVGGDHRLVTGVLKRGGLFRAKKGKKVPPRRAWRRRDRGDPAFWDELVWACEGGDGGAGVS